MLPYMMHIVIVIYTWYISKTIQKSWKKTPLHAISAYIPPEQFIFRYTRNSALL